MNFGLSKESKKCEDSIFQEKSPKLNNFNLHQGSAIEENIFETYSAKGLIIEFEISQKTLLNKNTLVFAQNLSNVLINQILYKNLDRN
jgi:hypothetical protein